MENKCGILKEGGPAQRREQDRCRNIFSKDPFWNVILNSLKRQRFLDIVCFVKCPSGTLGLKLVKLFHFFKLYPKIVDIKFGGNSAESLNWLKQTT